MRRLVSPVLCACALFLWPVDWSLWTDEFFSAGQAGRPVSDLVAVAAHDRHPPLYFIVVAAAGGIANTDWMVRLPSGIAAVLAVVATAFAARRLVGDRAFVPAAWWLATSPLVFTFAHSARMYALVLLWGALLLLGSALAAAGRRSGLALLGVVGTLALYTHYAAIVPVIAALLGAALGRLHAEDLAAAPLGRRLAAALPTGLVGLAVGLAFLPWALGPLRAQLAEETAVGPRSLWVETWVMFSPDEAWRPLTVVAAAVLGIGVLVLVRRRVGLGAAWLLVGLVGAWLLSEKLPARLPRNYLGLLPFFVVGGAGLLASPRLRLPGWLQVAVPLALQAPVLWQVFRMPYHPQDVGGGHDYRVEAALLDDLIPVNDRVRFQPAYVLGQFSRYAPGLKLRLGGDGPVWTLKPGGKVASPCAVEHAFRVRVDPPEGACPTVEAFLDTAPDANAYPALRYQRAVDRYQAGDLAGALEDLGAYDPAVARHPGPAELRARIAADRGDEAQATAMYTEALRVARAYDFSGKRVGGIWMQLARLARRRGDEGAWAHALAASECARTRAPAWACGGPFEPLTEAGVVEEADP